MRRKWEISASFRTASVAHLDAVGKFRKFDGLRRRYNPQGFPKHSAHEAA